MREEVILPDSEGIAKEDSWYDAFWKEKNRRRGIYEKISHIRWKRLIRSTVPKQKSALILKTDAWNEGMSRDFSLIDELGDDNQVILLDISLRILNSVEGDNPRVNCDIRHLPFSNDSIDCVLDISTSDHCQFAHFGHIIDEYSRVLRNNGTILLIHNSDASIIWKLLRRLGHISPAYSGDPPAYYFSPNQVIDSLLERRFRIIHRTYSNCFGWARRLVNHLPIKHEKILEVIAGGELRISNRFLRGLAREHIVIAEKVS